MLIQNLGIG